MVKLLFEDFLLALIVVNMFQYVLFTFLIGVVE